MLLSDAQEVRVIRMRAILGYCKAHALSCWIVHNPPESTIGGYSAELIRIFWDGHHVLVRIANGDTSIVPMEEIEYRTK